MRAIFFVLVFGFTSGIFFRSFFDLGASFTAFLALIGVSVFIVYLSTSRSRVVLFTALFIVGAVLGVIRLDIAERHNGDSVLDGLVGVRAEFSGVVVDEPDLREFNTHLTVRIDEARVGEEAYSTKSKALLIVDTYPEYQYGDKVVIEGELVAPKNFTSDTGREFNYVGFLEKDGIYYQMFRPGLSFIEAHQGNKVKETLFIIKHLLLKSMALLIPEPHVSLLGGLLVGAKQALGTDLLDSFRATGIIHIVVLSGYNVTIVAEALMRFFSFVPRTGRFALGAGSIVGFMIMVGAGATVVRASVMALLVVLARATGRTSEITTALVFAGLAMLAINPKILVFDPSFQLSFLATVGLIYLGPLIERRFRFVPTKWQLREFATATIATQIFVLPLLLYMTGKLSIVALPVNMLVLIVIPATMLFGFLAGVAGLIASAIALPFAYVAYGFLAYELKVVDIFAKLPFASVSVPPVSLWFVLVAYMVMLVVLWKWHTHEEISLTTSGARNSDRTSFE